MDDAGNKSRDFTPNLFHPRRILFNGEGGGRKKKNVDTPLGDMTVNEV